MLLLPTVYRYHQQFLLIFGQFPALILCKFSVAFSTVVHSLPLQSSVTLYSSSFIHIFRLLSLGFFLVFFLFWLLSKCSCIPVFKLWTSPSALFPIISYNSRTLNIMMFSPHLIFSFHPPPHSYIYSCLPTFPFEYLIGFSKIWSKYKYLLRPPTLHGNRSLLFSQYSLFWVMALLIYTIIWLKESYK